MSSIQATLAIAIAFYGAGLLYQGLRMLRTRVVYRTADGFLAKLGLDAAAVFLLGVAALQLANGTPEWLVIALAATPGIGLLLLAHLVRKPPAFFGVSARQLEDAVRQVLGAHGLPTECVAPPTGATGNRNTDSRYWLKTGERYLLKTSVISAFTYGTVTVRRDETLNAVALEAAIAGALRNQPRSAGHGAIFCLLLAGLLLLVAVALI